ncbi:MAG: hypothetical protein NTV86_05985 [Planctomycetota bacterium]|nr:hypothetical protein [Planctomycetota bacterium]
MSQEEPNNSATKHLPVLRGATGALASLRRRAGASTRGDAVFVRVRPHGERRRDFLRRFWFRGVDELRRQQRQADEKPPPRSSLDKLI